MVLDASITLAWCFEDEKTEETEELHELALSGTVELEVPLIWWTEVGNGLLVAERRGRSTPQWTEECLDMLNGLAVSEMPVDLEPQLDLARRRGLSLYDASYLQLAQVPFNHPDGTTRWKRSLATLDKRLRAAAIQENVPLLPEFLQ